MSNGGPTTKLAEVISTSTEKVAAALVNSAASVIGAGAGTSGLAMSTPDSIGDATVVPVTEAVSNPNSGTRIWNSTEFSSSFLEHASGQGISGVCVWAAILITCHQVGNCVEFFELAYIPIIS